jgi:uncharacterized iron-regulated membrane protein
LAFGKASLMPSSAPTVSTAARRLRAPIRGLLSGDDVKAFMAALQQQESKNNDRDESVVEVTDSSVQRVLQDGAAQSEFGLEVGLQGIDGGPIGKGDSSGGGNTAIVVALVVLFLLASGSGLVFYTKRRSRKEEEIVVVNKNHHDHSSAASVGTYPS